MDKSVILRPFGIGREMYYCNLQPLEDETGYNEGMEMGNLHEMVGVLIAFKNP